MRFHPLAPFHRRPGPAVRGDVNDPFGAFRTEIDRVFEDFFNGAPMRFAEAGFAPSIDVKETDTRIDIVAELPGLSSDDVEVDLDGDVLTLRGEKKEESEEKDEHRRVVERRFGAFERALRLPFTPDEKDVKAKFEKGVLTLSIAKPAELSKASKKIAIESD